MAEAQVNRQRPRVTRPTASEQSVENAPCTAENTPGTESAQAAPAPVVPGPAGGAASEVMQLVTFSVAAEEFSVPIRHVREIVRVPSVTRVPRTLPFVEGVANLRGTLLPIINLRRRFDLPAVDADDDMRAVVVEADGRLAGLVVDRVSEVIRVPASCVEPPPAATGDGNAHPWLLGVAKLSEGRRLVLLLDVDQIVPSSEIAQTVTRAAQATMTAREQQPALTQGRGGEQVVTFRLDDQEYALSIGDVREIIRPPDVSRIPHSPPFVDGVVSLRNRVVPIVNLRTRFAIGGSAADDDSRVVIANVGTTVVGMQVDAVSEVLSLPGPAVEELPRFAGDGDGEQLRGVAKLDNGQRLIMLLDASRILPIADMDSLAAITGKESAMDNTEVDARRRIADERLFVGFRIEQEEFGVPIEYVQEIIWMTRITRVPRTPPFVEGIINLRGNVLPVIDLRKRFSLPARSATESTSIIVVDVDGRRTGVIVDEVSEVRRLAADAIEPPPSVVGSIDSSFVKGIGKHDGSSGMIIILDLEGIVAVSASGATP